MLPGLSFGSRIVTGVREILGGEGGLKWDIVCLTLSIERKIGEDNRIIWTIAPQSKKPVIEPVTVYVDY